MAIRLPTTSYFPQNWGTDGHSTAKYSNCKLWPKRFS